MTSTLAFQLITAHAFIPGIAGMIRCEECGMPASHHAREAVPPPKDAGLLAFMGEWDSRPLPPVRVRWFGSPLHRALPGSVWVAWCRCCRWSVAQQAPYDVPALVAAASEHARLHLPNRCANCGRGIDGPTVENWESGLCLTCLYGPS